MNKAAASILALVLVVAVGFYFCCGFFVIQPIGAVPEGATIVYWRADTKLPFVASADGLMLERNGSVNLFGRAVMMKALSDVVVPRKIVRLPYSRQLYLYSTGGREFER